MKTHSRWFLAVLLFCTLILGARTVWILSASPIGRELYLTQWKTALGSLLGIQKSKLGDQLPSSQAHFWLDQVREVEEDCISADPKMMAKLAMGAAWVLDSPEYGFIRDYVRVKDDLKDSGLPISWRTELDEEAIAPLVENFESLCGNECLRQATKATRLDSENPQLWRARALLLFQFNPFGIDGSTLSPRQDDWLAVLDECAAHDPITPFTTIWQRSDCGQFLQRSNTPTTVTP